MIQPKKIDSRELQITSAFTAAIVASGFLLFYSHPLLSGLLIAWQALISIAGGWYNLSTNPYSLFFRRRLASRLTDRAKPVDSSHAVLSQQANALLLVLVLAGLAAGAPVFAVSCLGVIFFTSLVQAFFGFSFWGQFYRVRMIFARAVLG